MQLYPWQQDNMNSLLKQLSSGKLPHALLIAGADGIGKLNLAKTFVQRFFCTQAMGMSPCQSCDACHKFEVNTHPDLKLIEPPEGKQFIVVDQIRALIEFVSLTPHSSSKKIVIIDQAEKLNINAANSLLKTLEEPPESSMLILITHRPDMLLPTIRSRCQQNNLALPADSIAKTWLAREAKEMQKSTDVNAVLSLASGAPLKARQMIEDDVLIKRDQLFSSFEAIASNETHPIEVAKTWFKNDADFVVSCMLSWLVDIIRLRSDNGGTKPMISNTDIRPSLTDLAASLSLRNAIDLYQKLIQYGTLKKSNVNAQLILEDYLIDWKMLCAKEATNG